MTCKEIQTIVTKRIFEANPGPVITNFNRVGYFEADIMHVNRAGLVVEYEVKISRSDFLKDFKNKADKHKKYADAIRSQFSHIPNRFYFICPEGLIKPEELPVYAGLMYVTARGAVKKVKQSILLHKDKCKPELIHAIAQAHTERLIFDGLGYLAHKNKLIKLRNQEHEKN